MNYTIVCAKFIKRGTRILTTSIRPQRLNTLPVCVSASVLNIMNFSSASSLCFSV